MVVALGLVKSFLVVLVERIFVSPGQVEQAHAEIIVLPCLFSDNELAVRNAAGVTSNDGIAAKAHDGGKVTITITNRRVRTNVLSDAGGFASGCGEEVAEDAGGFGFLGVLAGSAGEVKGARLGVLLGVEHV